MSKFFNIKLLALLVVALSLVMSVSAVDLSQETSGASVANNGDWGEFSETTAGNDNASGGVVTSIDLSTSAVSLKWQGYTGLVSASVSLGSGGEALYSFGAVSDDQINYVFASQNSGFGFSTLVDNFNTEIVDGTMDGWLSFDSADQDSIKTTFGSSNGYAIAGLNNLSGAQLTAYNSTYADNGGYGMSIMSSTASPSSMNDIAFGVSVMGSQIAFDNSTTVDYELMVPADSINGNTYYFFLNLE